MQATLPGQRLAHLAPTGSEAAASVMPSSIRPLQSSSMPLHASGSGGHASGRPHALAGQPSSMTPSQLLSLQSPHTSTAQCLAPVPSRLSGSFGSLGLATAHLLLTPSSIRPLQLSSMPLQVSAGGTVD